MSGPRRDENEREGGKTSNTPRKTVGKNARYLPPGFTGNTTV